MALRWRLSSFNDRNHARGVQSDGFVVLKLFVHNAVRLGEFVIEIDG